MESRRADTLGPLGMGCLGAAIVALISSCMLVGLMVAPAFDARLPPPPNTDESVPDINIFVKEAYLDRTLTRALPGSLADGASLDVQRDNRLVISASVDLLLGEVDVVITLSMFAEAGELALGIESVETGGQDLLELLNLNLDTVARSMSAMVQDQVEAGLGEGARVLGVRMEDEQIIISARWP